MTLLLLYWGIMILCYLAACRLRAYGDRFGFISGALNVVIYILVFIMGLRMGANEEVTSSLGTIGLQSLFITVFTVAGSMMAVTVLRKILGLNKLGLPATDVYACDETAEPEIGTVGSRMSQNYNPHPFMRSCGYAAWLPDNPSAFRRWGCVPEYVGNLAGSWHLHSARTCRF